MVETALKDAKFDFISIENKEFIGKFDAEMETIGYSSGNDIGNGYCWGKYMIIYRKSSGKDKQGIARIYIRDDGIVLRLYLNKIDKHREYIEKAEQFIKEPFVNGYGICGHCHNEKQGICKFRKTYTLDDMEISKCNGMTFEFQNPDTEKLPEYMALLKEFLPKRKKPADTR